MSFKTEVIKNDYVGNDSIATYAYGFKIDKEEHLRVIAFTDDNVETVLVLNTDYTVSGVGKKNGGSITLLASGKDYLDTGTANLATGYNLLIKSNAEYKQETDIRNNGDFFPEVHEDTFDYSRRLDLQLFETVKRCVQLKESEDAEVKIERGSFGEVLRWNNQRNLEGVLLGAVAFSNSYDDLSDKPDIAVLAPVQSVASKTGAVTLVKGDVGLGNVDNTSDSDKPVSSDQQAALNLKADASDVSNVTNTSDAQKVASGPIKDALDALTLKGLADVDGSGFTTVSVVTYNPSTQEFEAGASGGGGAVDSVNGEIGVVVLDKSDIGLGNVDNTSDANKPVSSATQTALNAKADDADLTSGLALKANSADLGDVATSNSYDDLDGLPSIPNSISQLFGIYKHTLASGNFTTQATDQFLNFRNCSKVSVGGAGPFKGQIIFLGSSPLGGGETVPIHLASNDSKIGDWFANDTSFGALIAEEYDTTLYRWRIVDLNTRANFKTYPFTGDGTETDFILGITPASADQVDVHIDNVYQEKSSYTLSGDTLTFSPAPVDGASIEAKVTVSIPATRFGSANIASAERSGDGTETTFTLPATPVGVNDVLAFVGAEQTENFTVSGNQITFDTAPPSGTDNIVLKVFSQLEIGVPSDDTVGPSKIQDSFRNKFRRKTLATNVNYTANSTDTLTTISYPNLAQSKVFRITGQINFNCNLDEDAILVLIHNDNSTRKVIARFGISRTTGDNAVRLEITGNADTLFKTGDTGTQALEIDLLISDPAGSVQVFGDATAVESTFTVLEELNNYIEDNTLGDV